MVIAPDATKSNHPKTLIPLKLKKRILLINRLVTAVLIKLQVAMQDLWQLGLDWLEEVPTEARQKWLTLSEVVSKLNHIKFDRCLTPSEAVGGPKLIVFCDAPRHQACAFVRWKL